MAEERISASKVANILGVSKCTILRWAKQGKILTPKKDCFGYYYWPSAEFESYLSSEYSGKLMRFKDGY